MSLARPLGAGAASDLAPARTACSSTQLGERGAQQCGVDAVGRHAGLCVWAQQVCARRLDPQRRAEKEGEVPPLFVVDEDGEG
jgi:hypothetical protein